MRLRVASRLPQLTILSLALEYSIEKHSEASIVIGHPQVCLRHTFAVILYRSPDILSYNICSESRIDETPSALQLSIGVSILPVCS